MGAANALCLRVVSSFIFHVPQLENTSGWGRASLEGTSCVCVKRSFLHTAGKIGAPLPTPQTITSYIPIAVCWNHQRFRQLAAVGVHC